MRISVAVILTLLWSVSVHGFEFRGIQPGITCAQASEAEEQMGSTLVSSEWGIFLLRYEGFSAQIAYFCAEPADVVEKILFFVDMPSEAEAEKIYMGIRTELIGLNGSPCRDGASLSLWAKLKLRIRTFGMAFAYEGIVNSVEWQDIYGASAYLGIMRQPGEVDGWRVSVSLDRGTTREELFFEDTVLPPPNEEFVRRFCSPESQQ